MKRPFFYIAGILGLLLAGVVLKTSAHRVELSNNLTDSIHEENQVQDQRQAFFLMKGEKMKEVCFEYPQTSVPEVIVTQGEEILKRKSLRLFEGLSLQNSCLKIEKLIRTNQLILTHQKGDGLANTEKLFSYHLDEESITDFYKKRSWDVVDPDAGNRLWVVWARDDHYFLQVQQGQSAGPVYRGRSALVEKDSFFFDEVSGEVALDTTLPVNVHPLDEKNLMHYQEGLLFKVDKETVFLEWE